MIDIGAALMENPEGVLTTRDGDGLRSRLFTFLFADGNKAYFCTSSQKLVFRQLLENPIASFCSHPDTRDSFLSISGRAVFVEDAEMKARAMKSSKAAKRQFNSPDNPVFKVFYIEAAEVEAFSFAKGTWFTTKREIFGA